jgi:effector-binding domain-containing protein
MSDLQAFFTRALTRVLVAMEAEGTLPAGEPFGYYHTLQANGMVDVETGFPIIGNFQTSGDVLPGELPAGKAITGIHLGSYETLGNTYADMSAWAIAHGLLPTGELWEVYLTDPEREPDPNRWRTGVFLRVE